MLLRTRNQYRNVKPAYAVDIDRYSAGIQRAAALQDEWMLDGRLLYGVSWDHFLRCWICSCEYTDTNMFVDKWTLGHMSNYS